MANFFSSDQSSHCMYHFLIQTLICLGGTQRPRVRYAASARNFFVHLWNRTRLKSLHFHFFDTVLLFCLSPNGPLRFYWRPPPNIRSKALYQNFWRYIRTILHFTKEEGVRKQEFFMKTSYAYFRNLAFWAWDIVPTLDVPALFFVIRIHRNRILNKGMKRPAILLTSMMIHHLRHYWAYFSILGQIIVNLANIADRKSWDKRAILDQVLHQWHWKTLYIT